MSKVMKSFLNDESGAVTVDWVVLTAAIVGLGIAVISTVGRGALDTSTGLGVVLANKEVTKDYSGD
jgi:Flp pilus assembly pilin Flp